MIASVKVGGRHRGTTMRGEATVPSVCPYGYIRVRHETEAKFSGHGNPLAFGAADDDMDHPAHRRLTATVRQHVYIDSYAHIQSFVTTGATALVESDRRHSSLAKALWLWMLS